MTVWPESAGTVRGTGGLSPAARLLAWAAVLAILVLPVFAHGCHGDDVDHEPGFAPPRQPDRGGEPVRNSLP